MINRINIIFAFFVIRSLMDELDINHLILRVQSSVNVMKE